MYAAVRHADDSFGAAVWLLLERALAPYRWVGRMGRVEMLDTSLFAGFTAASAVEIKFCPPTVADFLWEVDELLSMQGDPKAVNCEVSPSRRQHDSRGHGCDSQSAR
jgi:hypothetical protein